MDILNKIVVTEIIDVMTVPSPKGRRNEILGRKSYGLSFCKEGQITYTHNGRKFVSDPEHAIILPKGQSYTLSGDKTGNFALINFDCVDLLCDTMMLLPTRNIEPLVKDFEQIKNLFLFERNRPKVISLFYNIIHNLSFSNCPEHNLLSPAIKYLEKNFSSPDLTNKVLAGQCNISEVYFRRLFIKIFGVTPKQYVIDARINKAKQMLTDGLLKIDAVSEACGFSNPYHFCRLFKQKTGLTPSAFAKNSKVYKI